MQNIFDDSNKVAGNWVKFTEIGDKFQGTYISKRETLNQLSGKDQWIYEFLDEKGEVWNVGGKPGIDMQMRHIKFGQIVGFEYMEERKNPRPGMNATKIIQVYAKADVVDQAWLESQEAQGAVAPTTSTAPATEATPAVPTMTDEQRLAKIAELVKAKWAIEAPEAVKEKVMTETGLAFIPANLDKIIEALSK